jgi:hypothetical protein
MWMCVLYIRIHTTRHSAYTLIHIRDKWSFVMNKEAAGRFT